MLWTLLGCVLWEEPSPPTTRPASTEAPRSLDELPGVPSTQGTPSESNKARPDWIPGTAYAPQAGASVRLDAEPAQGEVQGLVTCEIEADHQDPQGLFGQFRDPDLTTEMVFGAAEMKVSGPEDSRTMRGSAPLIHLKGGEAVVLRVYDRDVFKTEHIETLETTYDGRFPITLKGSTSNARCELVPRARVEALAAPLIDEAHEGIGSWAEDLAPKLQQEDLGGPAGRPLEALVESAALVGWQDERVQHLLSEHDALIEAYELELSAALAKAAVKKAGREGLFFTEPVLLCGNAGMAYTTEAGACALKLKVEGEGTVPGDGRLALVWSYGVVPLNGPEGELEVAVVDGEALLVTHQKVELSGPAYLRVGSPGTYTYVALTGSSD